MKSAPQLHDSVVLLEDRSTTHFETGQPIQLRRGQVGTVVMTHDGSAVEVEFSGRDGRAYALLPIPIEHLMVLRETPELAAAVAG